MVVYFRLIRQNSRCAVCERDTVQPNISYMKFDVLITVNIQTGLFWDVTPCGLVDDYQRFVGTEHVNLQDRSSEPMEKSVRNIRKGVLEQN
jgi:hypothetical protein